MITGKLIRLRPLELADIDLWLIWRNDPSLKSLAMMHPFPVTRELAESWFKQKLDDASNDSVHFIMEEISTRNAVGNIFLDKINWVNRNAWLGILIGKESNRGKGFGKEAVHLMIEYAFYRLNLVKILLEVSVINEQALNFYKKMGFQTEGILRDHFLIDGKYADINIMSIFKDVKGD